MKISASTQTIEENIEPITLEPNYKQPKETRQIIHNKDTNIEPSQHTMYPLKTKISHRNFNRNENVFYKELGSTFKASSYDKLENPSLYNNLDIFKNNLLNSIVKENLPSQNIDTFNMKGKTNENSSRNMFHNLELVNIFLNKKKSNNQQVYLNNNNQKSNSLSLPELASLTPVRDMQLFFGNGRVYENEFNENNIEAFMTIKNLLYYKILRSQDKNNQSLNNKKSNGKHNEKIHKNRSLHSIEMNLNVDDNMLLKGSNSNNGMLKGMKAIHNGFTQKQNSTKNEGNKEVIVFQPGSYALHSSRRNNSGGKVLIYKVIDKNSNVNNNKQSLKLPITKTPSIKRTAHCYDLMFSGPANFFLANNPRLALLKSSRLKQTMHNNISIDKKHNRYLKNDGLKEFQKLMKHSRNFSG
jgi:hypothetical protein